MKAEYSDTFQARLNELLDIKDKRIAELEAENARLRKTIDKMCGALCEQRQQYDVAE